MSTGARPPRTPVQGDNAENTDGSRWGKTAGVWKMVHAMTPNGKDRGSKSPGQIPDDEAVQLYTPLSGVPMQARVEPFMSMGSYNNRGSAHMNPFIEQ
jgi:hypothetical protein